MDRLQSMRVFQEVVEQGGFAAAARRLELSPAVVTRLVADLESHLGVRLLQRTTRRLSLTPAGEEYSRRLRAILADIDEADAIANSHTREMSGTVRILTLPVIASHVLAQAVTPFLKAHPEVVLDIHVEDTLDPPIEDYDLTILTDLVPLHREVVVRTLLRTVAVFCAAPSYLERYGVPQGPEDLMQHRFLRLRTPGVRLRPVRLIDPTDNDRQVEVDPPTLLAANHTDTLLRATIDGAGISSQPADLLAPHLRSGALQRVLAPWITNRLTLVAALPSRKFLPARSRAFLDHLAAHVKEAMLGLGLEEEGGAP